jgi:outer membrane lipoprotein-sorting protein
MRIRTLFFVFLAVTLVSGAAGALSGEEILKKVDQAEYGAKDTVAELKMVLVDKDGGTSERRMKILQKGDEQRLVKFLAPADVKGIGFLDAGEDKMYLYMPAFHKIRRIAGHVKNDSFAGTDFSYDDMSSERFSLKFDVSEKTEEGEHYVMILKSKPGRDWDYSKLKVWVRKKDFMFDKAIYFDKKGVAWKQFIRKEFKPVGKYTQSFWAEMTDLKKDHKTQMIVESVKCDTGLKDRTFSKRQLNRL